MAATKINFFNPVDVFALLASGWNVQTDKYTNADSFEEAVGLKADGNFSANDIFNNIKEGPVTYKAFAATGNLTLPVVGTVSAGGVLLKQFGVEYAVKDYPTLTAAAHKSVTGAAHGTYRTYTPTVVLPAGRGIPRALVDNSTPTAGDVFKLGVDDAGIGMLKMSYSLNAEFISPDTAEFTAGEFANAYEEITVGMSGVPAAITIGTGWEYVGKDGDRGNQTAEGFEITIRKRIAAHDAV